MSDTILVTGANRGIGLAMVQALLDRGHRVVAACRQPSEAVELAACAVDERLEIVALDVGDGGSVAALASELEPRRLDAVINNAGRMSREPGVHDIDYDDWLHTFAINSQAPLRVAVALKASLLRSARPRVLSVSSQMGSLQRAGRDHIAYRSSKAALNMAMRCLAEAWSQEGITVCMVHPGWVRSDMGGDEADLSTEDSAADLVTLLQTLTIEHSGQFLNHDGTRMPW